MLQFSICKYSNLSRDKRNQIFRLRYKIAVEKWGWKIPGIQNGLERDQFDNEDTTYILTHNRRGILVATARLNPTVKPHLMSEIFSHQCEFSGVPSSPDILELSRFIVDDDFLSHAQQVQHYLQLCLVVTQYALDSSIKQLTWLSHKSKYTKSIVVWKTRPLGLAQYYHDDDAEYIAAVMDVTQSAADKLTRFCKLKGRIPIFGLPPDMSSENVAA